MCNPIKYTYAILFYCILVSISNSINAQTKANLSDFVLYANAQNGSSGVTLSSSITIIGGTVGSTNLVKASNTTFNSNIFSRDSINIGGSVTGYVMLPVCSNYSGPVPGGGKICSSASVLLQPDMLTENSITGGSGTVTNPASSYAPGTYGTFKFSGNKTLKLKAPLNNAGPYIYNFKAFNWSGNQNQIVFDFNGNSGIFYIFIEGNADFGKLGASLIGGSADKIFVETHGNGDSTSSPGNSFIIANGSSSSPSKWYGTVYASRAGINIGSGTGTTTSTAGAFFSATNISIQSGVTVTYAPFNPCNAPNANAGTDRPFKFATLDTLIGTSTTPGVSFSWDTLPKSGAVIASDRFNDTIAISSAGSYILTVTNGASCFTKDTVVIAAKVPDLIGAELLSIYRNKTTSSPFFLISNGKVMIDVIAVKGKYDSALLKLQALGFTPPFGLSFVTYNGESAFFQTGEIPIDSLLKINNLGRFIKYCRPYYQPYTFNASSISPQDSVKTGLVISQGDTMIRTNLVRPGFKINGDGIKIGVISDSYGTILNGNVAIPPYNPAPGPIPQSFNITTVRQDIINGDVPSDTTLQIPNSSGIGTHDTLIKNSYGFEHNVHVLQEFPQQRSDEGRAMIQIIHDVAPGAEIYFNSGFFTAGEFAKTIKRLRDAGCKIIVDDVTFPTESFLRDGIIAKTADSVVRFNNVTYISSAGNFADQAYESDFIPIDASNLTGFNGLKAHNFGSGNQFQQILLRPGKYTFVFQWLDSTYSRGETLTGTKYNMDCFLSRQTNGGGLIGFNRDNTGGDPIEFIPIEILPDYPNDTTSKLYNLLIVNNTTTGDPARIKYIIYKRDANANIGYISHRNIPGVSVSTITGQANADSVISVGASRFNHTIDRYTGTPHPLLPDALIGITKPQLESFSSIGGGKIENIIRNKPNVTGSDGGNTTVKLGQDYPNNALDGFSNFFGTSAAAPHVAAAAALIMQGRKKFLAGHPGTSPWEIKDLLQKTAFDMETPGYDLKSGYGLVDADSAMRIFALPTPFEIKLVVPQGVVPGQTQFQLTITGQNFSSNSYVVVGDTTLINGVRDTTQYWPDAISRNQILVTLNSFDGNPAVMVYTPPKTAFGDAGYSNILYFFNGRVVVKAVDATMKYGQNVPLLDTIIWINDTLLQNSRYTRTQIGLDPLTVTTSGNQFTEVGPQAINVRRSFNINDPVDSAFLKNFSYQFIDATLTIGKMPLKVTPRDTIVTAGQYLGNLGFKYDFDPLYPPANPSRLRDTAQKYHQVFLASNALAVVKDFKAPQTGGYILSDADLVYMNMMTSFNALKNSRKFRIENGKLIPRGNTDSLDSYYLLDIASTNIYDYARVNKARTNFYTGYPGYTKKGLLSESALDNGQAQAATTNGGLATILNGNLAPMMNGNLASYLNASLAPMINGGLVSYLNGNLATLINGVPTPIANSPLVYLLNGNLVYLLNGSLAPIINGGLVTLLNGQTITVTETNSYVTIQNSTGVLKLTNGGLAQYLNGNLAPLINSTNVVSQVNGSLATLINGVPTPIANSPLVYLLNGNLVYLLNGSLAPIINGGLVTLLNGAGTISITDANSYVTVPDNSGSTAGVIKLTNGGLAQYLNGNLAPLINATPELSAALNGNLATLLNGNLAPLINGNLVSMLNGGLASYLNGSLAPIMNGNLATLLNTSKITFTNGGLATLLNSDASNADSSNNNGAVIIDETDVNPFNNNSLGAMFAINMITGLNEGTQTIVPGILVNPNFDISYGLGHAIIKPDSACLLTHSTAKNVTNTAQVPTTMWLSMTTKVSGQLTTPGDSLLFRSGSITFNFVNSTPIVLNMPVPNGMILAIDAPPETPPSTSWSVSRNMWITTVPKNYASTSDIFVTGALIPSTNGFTKSGGNTNSVMKGMFFSNKAFSDQWGYGLAPYNGASYNYDPTLKNPGDVIAINGNYRAGTPVPLLPYYAGTGNAYTGTSSSFENFTACPSPVPLQNRQVSTSESLITQANNILEPSLVIFPNPASESITLSIVPVQTGNVRIEMYTINGAKLMETNDGVYEAGSSHLKKINIGKLGNGIYLVRVWNGDAVTNKKIIISR